jgi:hypothetical protein
MITPWNRQGKHVSGDNYSPAGAFRKPNDRRRRGLENAFIDAHYIKKGVRHVEIPHLLSDCVRAGHRWRWYCDSGATVGG